HLHQKRSNHFAPIKTKVLGGIDKIESCHPANYARRKHDWRDIKVSGLSDPSADRSNGECQPEKKMRCASEPLRHRIEKNQCERYGREDACKPINCARGQQKPGTTENQHNHGRQFWYEQVSRGRARVALIKRQVNEPVEKNGCHASKNHAVNLMQNNSQRW